MTKRQLRVLSFVENFWETHKHSPSYREISETEEIALSHTYAVVLALSRKGFLHAEKGRARAIYPIPVWREMRHETDLPKTA